MKNKILKTIIGLILTSILLYLSLKNQNINKIINTITNANLKYIIIASIFYFISYVAHSEKWKVQIENVNYKLKHSSSFYAVMTHFFINSFTVKFGIIFRCGYLKKNANIPFVASLGVILSESIFDYIFIAAWLIIILTLDYNEIAQIFVNIFNNINTLITPKYYYIIAISAIASIAIIIAFIFLYKNNKIFKKNNKIKNFTNSVKKTFKIKKFGLFLFWNIILWTSLYFMNNLLFMAIFNNNANFNIIASITVFSYLAWLMPSPGGIGSVEFFILQVFMLFGLNKSSALAFGILSNGFTLISTLIFGFTTIIVKNIGNILTHAQKNKHPKNTNL